jgi:hypothetical protein
LRLNFLHNITFVLHDPKLNGVQLPGLLPDFCKKKGSQKTVALYNPAQPSTGRLGCNRINKNLANLLPEGPTKKEEAYADV